MPSPRGGEPLTTWTMKGGESFNPCHAICRPSTGMFQSTPPRGGRLGLDSVPVQPLAPVSIHAPARGATPGDLIAVNDTEFQSTPPRGGRRGAGRVHLRCQRRFQSTPPRGGPARGTRRQGAVSTLGGAGFNPRPRAGGDAHAKQVARVTELVSIHAPARGATLGRHVRGRAMIVSIHAPARGATRRLQPRARQERGSFNPRPRAGGDFEKSGPSTRRRSFNPRPRAGGDLLPAAGGGAPRSGFNPRPRAGGDHCRHGITIHALVFQSTPPRGGRLR